MASSGPVLFKCDLRDVRARADLAGARRWGVPARHPRPRIRRDRRAVGSLSAVDLLALLQQLAEAGMSVGVSYLAHSVREH